MKTYSTLLLLFIITSLKSYSQNANEFRIYYGFVDSKLLSSKELDGGASYDNSNSYEFGFKYLKKLSNKLSVETGINFIRAKVKITPEFMGTPVNSSQEDLKLVSIPFYVNYCFGKYFYINGGPTLDFQKGEKSFDSQSGIGYSLGVGGKYNFKNFLIYINPNFKRHSLISFEKENHYQKLTQFGIQIGIGYKF
ncbi:MAG: hypothetical protein CR989_02520 [Flavobacteriales bacterium]|nr:MAG: hypothetical protein CR989_02520 [Flavobacteriales bacterium]